MQSRLYIRWPITNTPSRPPHRFAASVLMPRHSCVFSCMLLHQSDLDAIEAILGPSIQPDESTWHWNLKHADSGRVLALTICNTDLGKGALGCVVSAQTFQGYVELHDVTGYLCIQPDEVMFIAKQSDRFDSLVIGSACTCSQFGNVRASLLSADITTINPALLMAAMQLSLAEPLLETLS